MKSTHPVLVGLLLLANATASFAKPTAQSPASPWRTISTAHYRIHYPDQPEFDAFAKETASRIEGLHGLYPGLIGHVREEPTDILIRDPFLAPNGLTFAQLKRPCIELWRTSPESDLEIAHMDWATGLAAHELVHLHHLTWPDRRQSVWRRLSYDSLGLGPIVRKGPAWLFEGYATLLEGKLTGQGRPHTAFRALVLREWAREGRLPIYDRLSALDPVVAGAGLYLVSSSFLGWLEQGSPKNPKVLQDLWKRMASPRYKTFDTAFRATFGQLPAAAYARFCAELTHGALEMERRMKAAGLQEGEPWTRVDGVARDLSVSPDGGFLLAQVLQKKQAGLWIWDLNAPPSNTKAKEKATREDPELPPEAEPLAPERKSTRQLGTLQSFPPEHPRWTLGGMVAFDRRAFDAEGTVRLVEDRWASGVAAKGDPAIVRLWPVREGDAWILKVEGQTLKLPFEPFGSLAWDRGRKLLYASTPVDGVLELVRMAFDPLQSTALGSSQVLTRTASGVAYPAPSPDGKTLYFALLTARGAQIRRLALATVGVPGRAWTPESEPFVHGAVRSDPDAPSLVPPPQPIPAAHPYRIGESHVWSLRNGLTVSPSDTSYRLGVGGNDFLGRLDWILEGVTGFPPPGSGVLGPRGGFGGLAWNGWAWSPRLQVFSQLLEPSHQRFLPVPGWDQSRQGGEVAAVRAWPGLTHGGSLGIAWAEERVERLGTPGSNRRSMATFTAKVRGRWERGGVLLAVGASTLDQWGHTEGQAWDLEKVKLKLQASYAPSSMDLSISGETGRIHGTPGRWDRFHFGGQSLGLLPPSLEANQVFQVALPMYSQTGDRYTRWRAQTLGGLLYLEGTALWERTSSRPAYTRVVGLELGGDSRDILIFGDVLRRLMGSFQLSMGIHRALDGPMKSRTVGTVALINRF